MTRRIVLFILLVLSASSLLAQESSSSHTGRINGGFYMKLGPVFPAGVFKSGQVSSDETGFPYHLHTFVPAKTGAGMDMGYLIYIGPTFVSGYLRAGIDATFISFWFNPVNPVSGESTDTYKYWYYFIGQKFGPVITVNPIDRLMVDFSYKIGCFGGYQNDDWGIGFWQSEVGANIRYSVMMVGFQYGWGKMNYNDFNTDNPDQVAQIITYRLLFGLKF